MKILAGESLRARREAAMRRMAEYGGPILAARDATGVNCNARLKTEGMGRVSGEMPGVDVHSRMAVTACGLVLGMLDRSSYNRAEPKGGSAGNESKKARPIEEKKSFRWLGTLERITADIPPEVKVITVCDREVDMAD
jgi:hypothetical protein